MIRVLVAEDQTMILGALAAMLDMEDDIEVMARATNGDDALRLAEEERPDVVVTDIEMPGMSGLEFAAALKERKNRGAGHHRDDLRAARLPAPSARCGVKGYLLKDAPAQQLATCRPHGA